MVGWFFQFLSKLYMKTLYFAPCTMVDDLSIVAAYSGLKYKNNALINMVVCYQIVDSE